MEKNLIFKNPPFKSCHAATVIDTKYGLLAAYFAGPREGHPKTCIWLSRYVDDSWQNSVLIIDSKGPDGKLYPLWNPVFFKDSNSQLTLYFKYGNSPSCWQGKSIRSNDDGVTWSAPETLPKGFYGPAKNKPLEIADGHIISPGSEELGGWSIHFEVSYDYGCNWTKKMTPEINPSYSIIQPSLLDHGNGKIQALCRSKQRVLLETWSLDYGETWSPAQKTGINNPNSAIETIKYDEKKFFLVFNDSVLGRSPLDLAFSSDGKEWHKKLTLEEDWGEFSYPSATVSENGDLHILYTFNRVNIMHVRINKLEVEKLTRTQ